jgi:hypothetical protein
MISVAGGVSGALFMDSDHLKRASLSSHAFMGRHKRLKPFA